MTSSAARPLLDGLRVVEISGTDAAARVAQFLADHGAEVCIVEPPAGTPLRRRPGWLTLGRGKRSVVADPDSEQGAARLIQLLESADVLVHAMRPSAMRAHRLTYSDLESINPRLVVAAISGFGKTGPFKELKGYEGIVMAKLGVYESFSRATRRAGPTFLAVPYASYCAAQTALHGILAALIEREQSGLGQQIETNMAQSLATLDCWIWFLRVIAERYPDAYTQTPAFDEDGNPNAHQVLTLLVAATSDDRWLQFAQLQPHLFAAFLRTLGMNDIADEPGWQGLPIYDSKEKRTAVWERFLEGVHRWSLAEWQERFDADPDVFAELFRSGTEVLDHPAMVDNWVVSSNEPDVGPVRQLGRVVRVRGMDWVPPSCPPLGDADDKGPTWTGAGWQQTKPQGTTVTPLAGITILDLCVWYAAPYATALMTDLGARVIHVEPLEGDPIRVAAGFPEAGAVKVMQGKESIAVDLRTSDGQAIVRQLAARSTAVLHSFRAGVARRFGLDVDSLRAVNPALVYVDATGYGAEGPYAHWPSYAPSIAVAAGLSMGTVEPHLGAARADDAAGRKELARRLSAATSAPPVNADGLSALGTASALLLGILASTRGTAPHVETTMLSTAASVNFEALIEAPGSRCAQPDPELFGFGALYRLYESADGWIFLAAVNADEWEATAKVLAPFHPFDGDPRFGDAASRAAHDGELAEILASVFKTRSGMDWEKELTAADVGCAVSSTAAAEAMFMSPDVGAVSGYVTRVTHPLFDEHPRLAPVVRFSRSQTQAGPGCLAGQHTSAILRELGMDEATISGLKKRRVVL